MARKVVENRLSTPDTHKLAGAPEFGTFHYVPNQRIVNHLNTRSQVATYDATKQMLGYGVLDLAGEGGDYTNTLV